MCSMHADVAPVSDVVRVLTTHVAVHLPSWAVAWLTLFGCGFNLANTPTGCFVAWRAVVLFGKE